MADDRDNRKVFKVFSQEFIVDARYNVTKELVCISPSPFSSSVSLFQPRRCTRKSFAARDTSSQGPRTIRFAKPRLTVPFNIGPRSLRHRLVGATFLPTFPPQKSTTCPAPHQAYELTTELIQCCYQQPDRGRCSYQKGHQCFQQEDLG